MSLRKHHLEFFTSMMLVSSYSSQISQLQLTSINCPNNAILSLPWHWSVVVYHSSFFRPYWPGLQIYNSIYAMILTESLNYSHTSFLNFQSQSSNLCVSLNIFTSHAHTKQLNKVWMLNGFSTVLIKNTWSDMLQKFPISCINLSQYGYCCVKTPW